MDRAFGALALYPQHSKSSKGCKRGKLVKKLLREAEAELVTAKPTAEQLARASFVDAGMQYCVARCGGCDLTIGWKPPA